MFDENLWKEWVARENKNYRKEGTRRVYLSRNYTHFDEKFWFPERVSEIEELIRGRLKFYNTESKRTETWQFAPFLKIELKTPRYKWNEKLGRYNITTKTRPVCFAAHKDALLFSYYAFALSRKYEEYISGTSLNDCVLAYRSGTGFNNIQFAKQVFDQIVSAGHCTAIALDITGYFDNIDHSVLKSSWEQVIGERLPSDQFKLFRVLTEYGYVLQNSLLRRYVWKQKRNARNPSSFLKIIPKNTSSEKYRELREQRLFVTNSDKKGIPQGSAMSAVLSNIYLVDLDKELSTKAEAEHFFYRRYCDDILVVCNQEKAIELYEWIVQRVSSPDFGLKIKKEKTDIVDFVLDSKGSLRAVPRDKVTLAPRFGVGDANRKLLGAIQYLGFQFDGQKTLIRPSSLSRYHVKTSRRIRKTMSMAYGRAENSQRIHLRQIFERYSHFGFRNFLTYARSAASNTYQTTHGVSKYGLGSKAINRQLKNHMAILRYKLRNKNCQFFAMKAKQYELHLTKKRPKMKVV